MITPINTFRTIIFPDLATANASNRLIGWGEMAVIVGDSSRVKFGFGYRNSAKNPAAPTALKFSALPWVNTNASAGNTPPNTYAANATATLTAAQLANKYITSTSAAATTLTLPTATLLGTQLGAVKGTTFEFTVDNSGGANTVTVAVSTGITVATAVITGADTLTVASGKVGKFSLFFTSPTAALLSRVQ